MQAATSTFQKQKVLLAINNNWLITFSGFIAGTLTSTQNNQNNNLPYAYNKKKY